MPSSRLDRTKNGSPKLLPYSVRVPKGVIIFKIFAFIQNLFSILPIARSVFHNHGLEDFHLKLIPLLKPSSTYSNASSPFTLILGCTPTLSKRLPSGV